MELYQEGGRLGSISLPGLNEHINLMIKAVTVAPLGYNQQPWKFIVIQNKMLQISIANEVCKIVFNIVKNIKPRKSKYFSCKRRDCF
jgi:nitroreductase